MARATLDRPPPKVFLGVGALFLGVNHLSVVLGLGFHTEALLGGCWLVSMGAWSLFAGRAFDVVWAWVNRSGWRVIGFVLLTLAGAVLLAEAVARIGYGRPL